MIMCVGNYCAHFVFLFVDSYEATVEPANDCKETTLGHALDSVIRKHLSTFTNFVATHKSLALDILSFLYKKVRCEKLMP